MTYIYFGKRSLDKLVAFLLLIIFSPLLVFCALGIRISSRGPIFFCQKRIGLDGNIFLIFKLRTLHVSDRRLIVQTSDWDDGVFLFGGILRRFKIDELPQLVNVIKGDMSFVGPRPLIPQIYDDMPQWAKKRSKVLPGLTGLAQVSGNACLSWEDKWMFDLMYLDKISFIFDLRLLIKTLLVILIGEKHFADKP